MGAEFVRNIIAAGAAAISISAAAPALAEGTVKIGMITTLSGGGSGLGIDARDGFLLALKLAGEAADNIEVVVADDAQRPELAVQAADKMIQSDQVDILTGIIWSNLAMAVVPSVVAQGKFYLSPNAGPSQLAGAQCHENYFNVAWQNDTMHEAAGSYASEVGYERVFLVAPNYPAGTDAITGFKRFYRGEVAQELYTQLGQSDYSVEIAQIRASDADAVFIFLPGAMGIAFMRQYSPSDIAKPVLGAGFVFDQDVLPAIGNDALGVRNTAHWSPELDNAANVEFVAAFQAEFGRMPSIFASQGYDTAKLILSAAAKASVTDQDAFRDALREADFASTRGAFEFGNNHHPVQDIYVREVVEQDSLLTNRIIGTVLEDHQDAYASQCPM